MYRIKFFFKISAPPHCIKYIRVYDWMDKYLVVGGYGWHIGSCYAQIRIPALDTGVLGTEARQENMKNKLEIYHLYSITQ